MQNLNFIHQLFDAQCHLFTDQWENKVYLVYDGLGIEEKQLNGGIVLQVGDTLDVESDNRERKYFNTFSGVKKHSVNQLIFLSVETKVKQTNKLKNKQ